MKISNIIYCSTLVFGGGAIVFDQTLLGVAILFIGLFLTLFTDPTLGTYSSSTRSKKPYYKNEFEEYQHYKHCKRHLK